MEKNALTTKMAKLNNENGKKYVLTKKISLVGSTLDVVAE